MELGVDDILPANCWSRKRKGAQEEEGSSDEYCVKVSLWSKKWVFLEDEAVSLSMMMIVFCGTYGPLKEALRNSACKVMIDKNLEAPRAILSAGICNTQGKLEM